MRLHVLHALVLLIAVLDDPQIWKPTGVYASKQPQWYIVSEEWCVNCKGPKKVFLGKGWPEANVLTMDQCQERFGFRPDNIPYEFTPLPPAKPLPEVAAKPISDDGRYATYGGRRYDLTTWRRQCSMQNCQMCAYLDQMQANYFARRQASIPSPQAPSPDDVIAEALVLMKLTPDDVVAELGSGDGTPAIKMARETGCRVVGVEIDHNKAVFSRKRVQAAGLGDRITIVEGDVLDFDPKQHGITAIYAYLDPLLLAQLTSTLSAGRVAVFPGHKPEGINTTLVGQCYVREGSL